MHICRIPANTGTALSPPTIKDSIPYKTKGFDQGHICCALPICGLLPEETLYIHHTWEVRPAKVTKPNPKPAVIPQKNEQYHATPEAQRDWTGRA